MPKLRSFLFVFSMALGLVGIFENAAKAGILDLGNGFSFNDTDLILTDVESKKEWLNLTLTTNRTYADISDKFDVNEEFAGWQYASSTQFNNLVSRWTNTPILKVDEYGEPLGTSHLFPNLTLASLIPYIGNTSSFEFLMTGVPGVYDWGRHDFAMTSSGMLSDGVSDDFHHIFGGDYQFLATLFHEPATGTHDVSNYLDGYVLHGDTDSSFGSYLIRDVSVVPLPPSAILFGTALLGLVGLRRRKRKA